MQRNHEPAKNFQCRCSLARLHASWYRMCLLFDVNFNAIENRYQTKTKNACKQKNRMLRNKLIAHKRCLNSLKSESKSKSQKRNSLRIVCWQTATITKKPTSRSIFKENILYAMMQICDHPLVRIATLSYSSQSFDSVHCCICWFESVALIISTDLFTTHNIFRFFFSFFLSVWINWILYLWCFCMIAECRGFAMDW